ncbi:efflux RND transporter periplasmic adaptor subunit [Owenweeksia hongkongensis]|uniref:efflux RND transporter periplasmic adaptor subunit n=1 Tax=Owenweeksia hongkongensis TaxID=253245 RepID=UPI003A90103B
MKRKIIIIAASALILFGGFTVSNILKESKKAPVKKKTNNTTTVFVETVKNATLPIQLTTTGSLEAKNRVEIYAEVQGVMTSPVGSFKEGSSYKKGSTLVSIESDVYSAGLMSQKSSLQNLVTSALADIRLDYPKAFKKWNDFLSQIDVTKPLPQLPEAESDKEKMFITGRNIYSTYYNVRNMELTLAKYNIAAPFDGVLVEALVTPGSLIRTGQKLGTFIQPTIYEIEAPVSSSMINFLKIGQKVAVTPTTNNNQEWEGEITRINRLVNSETQTTNVFIQLKGEGLEEGMFVKTNIMATEMENAYELSRSVIFDTDQVFVVQDSLLAQKTIEPIYYNEKTVVVRGLEDGEQTLSKLPSGAYSGMKVGIYTPQ